MARARRAESEWNGPTDRLGAANTHGAGFEGVEKKKLQVYYYCRLDRSRGVFVVRDSSSSSSLLITKY